MVYDTDYYKTENVIERDAEELLGFLPGFADYKEEIKAAFHDAYSGNCEQTISNKNGNPIIRLCQEDEFDQHMDQTEYDGWENIGYAGNHYVFVQNPKVTYTNDGDDE